MPRRDGDDLTEASGNIVVVSASHALQPLERDFFARPGDEVARRLLGSYLVRRTKQGSCLGRIVETEAYAGPEDLASHARAGRTARTRPMFGEVGRAYVYLVYGLHECLNVVAHPADAAGAVLLRAVEPIEGVELMRARRRRAADDPARLAAGPARLCQAFAVDRSFNGHDMTTPGALWLARPPAGEEPADNETVSGPRVGVAYAGPEWAGRPWRFWLKGNAAVSREMALRSRTSTR